jgi:hypothetical protein
MKNNIHRKITKMISKKWINNENGIYTTFDDKNAIDILGLFGAVNMDKISSLGKSFFIGKVLHDTSLNLLLLIYSNVQGDSGWVGIYAKQFLTKNHVNLALFKDEFDIDTMCSQICEMTIKIVKEKNLPISVGTLHQDGFCAVVETDSIMNNIMPKTNASRN